MEVPKYTGGDAPESVVDKWAYFFREAGHLMAIPEALRHPPVLDALEGARAANFTREEWEAYLAAGIAIQDERGRMSLARREGHDEGRVEEAAESLLTVLRVRGLAVSEEARPRIVMAKDPARIRRWLERAIGAGSVEEVLGAR
jgi:hypothetical protein